LKLIACTVFACSCQKLRAHNGYSVRDNETTACNISGTKSVRQLFVTTYEDSYVV